MKGLCYAYGYLSVLAGLDLELGAGEILALLGPNGVGKSTLLGVLAGLVPAAKGTVLRWGRPPRAGDGTVLLGHQSFLFEELTAMENLEYWARLAGLPLGRAGEALAAEGLGLSASVPVHRLSRGTVQRLAICRAWLGSPRLVLADGPSTGLDPDAAARLWARLGAVRDSGGAAVVVGHDVPALLEHADRYAILAAGRLLDQGEAAPWRGRSDQFVERYRQVVASAPRRRPTALGVGERVSSPVGGAGAADWWRSLGAVLARDGRLWTAGSERLGLVLSFGLLAALIFGLALDPTTVNLRPVFVGILWVALMLAGLPAFGASLATEWENDALDGYRAAGHDPAALFYGKALVHLAVMVLAEAVLVPAFLLLLQVRAGAALLPLLGALALGTVGFVAASTLVAAVVSRALGSRAGAVLPLISLPLLSPLLLGTVRLAQGYLDGTPGPVAPWVWMQVAYALLFWALPAVLFGLVAEA